MFFSLPREIRPTALAGCLLLAALIAGGCGNANSKPSAGENARGKSAANESAIAVTTTKAVAREVPSYIQATGSLLADETSDVAPQVSGQVVATPVNIGAFVKQGAVIARLNDRDARLRLQQTQADLRQAIAIVRQAEARLGLTPESAFSAIAIPEVRAAAAKRNWATA